MYPLAAPPWREIHILTGWNGGVNRSTAGGGSLVRRPFAYDTVVFFVTLASFAVLSCLGKWRAGQKGAVRGLIEQAGILPRG